MTLEKVLYLVRHGHYDIRDPSDPTKGKALHRIGIQQAERTGQRFAALETTFDRVVCSDYTRAKQTAEAIVAKLPEVPLEVDPDLREIQWSCHERGTSSVAVSPAGSDLRSHPSTAVAAFNKYFACSSDRPRREILVCHGNLIVYFLSRLETATRAQWETLFIHYCSVTEIHIGSTGMSDLVSFCDEVHLPPQLQL